MTPQEIYEYKSRWMQKGGYAVTVDSDHDWRGKWWCSRYLERHQWSFSSYTDHYEHTFYFEHKESAERFEKEYLK